MYILENAGTRQADARQPLRKHVTTMRSRRALLLATAFAVSSAQFADTEARAATIISSSTALTQLNTFQPGGGAVTIASNVTLEGLQAGTFSYDLTNQGSVVRNSSGTNYLSAVTFTAGSSLTNQAGATIRATNGYAIVAVLAPVTVTNAGTISATGQNYSSTTSSVVAAGIGVYLDSGGDVINASTGRITSDFEGVYVSSTASSLSTVQNSGVISSRREGVVMQTTNGAINNAAGATIEATVASGIRFGYPGTGIGKTYTLSNAGTVTGVTEGIVGEGTVSVNNAATGIITGATGISITFGPTTIVNAGRITGTGGTAIDIVSGGSALTNSQGGTVDGRIRISSVINAGTIKFGSNIVTSTTSAFTNTASGALVMKINETGASDKLVVAGVATLQGGTVSILAPDGAWSVARQYTILSATGGVNGAFSSVDINQPYLTPTLSYTSNEVTLAVVRNSGKIQGSVVQRTSGQQISSSSRRVRGLVERRFDDALLSSFGPDNSYASATHARSVGDTGWNEWASFSADFLKQNIILPNSPDAQRVSGDSLSFLAGVEHPVAVRTIAGAFVGYESLTYDLPQDVGETKNKGPMLGGYVGVNLTDWAFVGIHGGYSWQSNRIAESYFGAGTAVTGEFDSSDIFAAISARAHKTFDGVSISGGVNYTYIRRKFDAYTASDSTAVATTPISLGRVTPNIEAAFVAGPFIPYVAVGYEWDVKSTLLKDTNGADLGAGVRLRSGAFQFSLDGRMQVGRRGERSTSMSANVAYAF